MLEINVQNFIVQIGKLIAVIKGDSSADVANKLRDRGIRGKRQASQYCPLANYFKEALGLDRNSDIYVAVGRTEVSLHSRSGHSTLWAESMPESLCRFVSDFDGGKYPKLDLNHVA